LKQSKWPSLLKYGRVAFAVKWAYSIDMYEHELLLAKATRRVGKMPKVWK
jgi:hypothetical protein